MSSKKQIKQPSEEAKAAWQVVVKEMQEMIAHNEPLSDNVYEVMGISEDWEGNNDVESSRLANIAANMTKDWAMEGTKTQGWKSMVARVESLPEFIIIFQVVVKQLNDMEEDPARALAALLGGGCGLM